MNFGPITAEKFEKDEQQRTEEEREFLKVERDDAINERDIALEKLAKVEQQVFEVASWAAKLLESAQKVLAEDKLADRPRQTWERMPPRLGSLGGLREAVGTVPEYVVRWLPAKE